jgi:hypothetical protein
MTLIPTPKSIPRLPPVAPITGSLITGVAILIAISSLVSADGNTNSDDNQLFPPSYLDSCDEKIGPPELAPEWTSESKSTQSKSSSEKFKPFLTPDSRLLQRTDTGHRFLFSSGESPAWKVDARLFDFVVTPGAASHSGEKVGDRNSNFDDRNFDLQFIEPVADGCANSNSNASGRSGASGGFGGGSESSVELSSIEDDHDSGSGGAGEEGSGAEYRRQ